MKHTHTVEFESFELREMKTTQWRNNIISTDKRYGEILTYIISISISTSRNEYRKCNEKRLFILWMRSSNVWNVLILTNYYFYFLFAASTRHHFKDICTHIYNITNILTFSHSAMKKKKWNSINISQMKTWSRVSSFK